ncbi:hypothetical protein CYMTET_9972 [Cymbomonas tetramitiformis]|uniref:Uncharacterized protein n=1 Tax=Cymbomonas tetramitiformis TaxID=36881 RepID=A0AAE0C8B2_9CHLO|nr:hypothetical protein CYMTET_41215 [Cymbomonas tetramitiformis]KAK3282281.1 hypothetical protein CYMTET_9972 [Cymbomonas tetramitiformis]
MLENFAVESDDETVGSEFSPENAPVLFHAVTQSPTDKAVVNRAPTPLLIFQQRYGSVAVNIRKNRFFELGSKSDAALEDLPKFDSGLFHHLFLAVALGIVEEDLVLEISVPSLKD